MGRSIRAVEPSDLGEVFTLQRAAFVDEARLYETPSVPALDETFEDFTQRMASSTSWAAIQGNRIVGAVSLRTQRRGIPNVERLMVAPDCRGQGISSVLMQTVEDTARSAGHQSLQLVVGDLATNNRAIYGHLGWIEQSSERLAGFEHVLLHIMIKTL
ncbi:MAG: GNAT superfamily N-acetyltransferase [Acidimicrobiales bacterium]